MLTLRWELCVCDVIIEPVSQHIMLDAGVRLLKLRVEKRFRHNLERCRAQGLVEELERATTTNVP